MVYPNGYLHAQGPKARKRLDRMWRLSEGKDVFDYVYHNSFVINSLLILDLLRKSGGNILGLSVVPMSTLHQKSS